MGAGALVLQQRRAVSGTSAVQKVRVPVGIKLGGGAQVETVRDQVRADTLARFCTLCRRLNVDPRSPQTLLQVVYVGSRCHHDLEAREEIESGLRELGAEAVQVDWEHVARMAREHYFCTIHDWHCMLGYLDCRDWRQFAPSSGQLLARAEQALQHAGLDRVFAAGAEVLARALLHLFVSFTPQDKMLERFFVGFGRAQGLQPPHDLEVLCLRALAHFNDSLVSKAEERAGFLAVLRELEATEAYVQDVHRVLAQEAENSVVEGPAVRQRRRLRLREFVQHSHVGSVAQSYERSFAYWANQQRFPITTSLRMQELLYFLRVQEEPVPREVYLRHFTEGVAERVLQSQVESIDAQAVQKMVRSVRTYKHSIPNLVDFRVHCLAGLSMSTRSNLTLGQVVQLYVSCFQHRSVREEVWRGVVNVWNHSVASACQEFGERERYHIEPVVSMMVDAITEAGPRGGEL